MSDTEDPSPVSQESLRCCAHGIHQDKQSNSVQSGEGTAAGHKALLGRGEARAPHCKRFGLPGNADKLNRLRAQEVHPGVARGLEGKARL